MSIWNSLVKHHRKALIGLGILMIILGGLHLFITQKSALILEKIVSQASKGKYVLHSSSIEFSYLPPNIHATFIRIEPQKDSIPQTFYQLSVDTLHIRIKSLWDLLFRKSIDIEDISLENPSIVIKANPDLQHKKLGEFNLHGNLLLIKKELNKMISLLKMRKFRIDNASLKIFTDSNQYFLMDRVFLHIDDLETNLAANANLGNLDLQAAIHLWIDKPNIVWPDSNLFVSLDNFDWNSRNHIVSLQNIGFGWKRHREKTDSVHAELHSVVLKNLDWTEWINSGKMNYDSITANSGSFSLTLLNKAEPKDTTRISKSFLSMVSPLAINHFVVREIRSQAIFRGGQQPVIISVTGDSLKTENLTVDINRKTPFGVKSLELSIREFKGKDESENWQSSFSSFHILKDHIAIKDYNFRLRNNLTSSAGNLLSVPRLDMTGLSVPSLLEGKLIVNDLFMDRPFFQLRPQQEPDNKKAHSPYKPLASHFPFLNIKTIHLKNGRFRKTNPEDGNVIIAADGIYGLMYANKLLGAKSFLEFPAAFGKLGMDEFEFNSRQGRIELNDIQLLPSDHRLTLNKGKYSLASENGSFAFSRMSLSLDSIYSLIQEKKSIHVRQLQIDSGTITFNLASPKTPQKKITSPKKNLPIWINEISINNINLRLSDGGNSMTSRIKTFSLQNLNNADENWGWDKAEGILDLTIARGRNWEFTSSGIALNNRGLSSFSDVTFSFQDSDKKLKLSAPSLQWQWPLHTTAMETLSIPLLLFNRPQIEFTQKTGYPAISPVKSPEKKGRDIHLKVDSLKMELANVLFISSNDSSLVKVGTTIQHFSMSNVGIEKINGKEPVVRIDDMAAKIGASTIQKNSNFIIGVADMQLSASKFMNAQPGKPMNLEVRQFTVDSVHGEHSSQNKKINFEAGSIRINENLAFYFNKDSLIKWKYEIPPISVEKGSLALHYPKNKIVVENISADLKNRKVSADSFRIENKIARDEFFAHQAFQKDYLSFKSGHIELRDFDIQKQGTDTGLLVKSVRIGDLFLMAERDKLRPEDTTARKPMLVELVKKIPFNVIVDTLGLEKATIWHNVIAKKTAEQGTIFFTDVTGWLSNIKNYRQAGDDTLRIRVNANLMGKGNLTMGFRESYLDSLQGFYLSARMGKFDMPELNRILVPLILIKITKGYIDTLWLEAHANTILAFGQMQIDYRKLHVEKLDLKQKKQGFISWLANIIVRTNNEKDGAIYVERLPNKSIFNYWGRISLSGFLTNIRVASNKKYKKKYEEALIKYKLPPHLLD